MLSSRRVLVWDMKRAARMRPYLGYVERPDRRSWVESSLDRFERFVRPVLQQLRSSIIHNDVSHTNLILEAGENGRRRLSGIIDFGVAVETYTVIEPAVAAAYLSLQQEDPLAVAASILGGYQERHPLNEAELEVFYDFMRLRLCASVTYSAYAQELDPGNAYRKVNEEPAWAALEKLVSAGPRLISRR